jgi:hypothetical protein
MLFIQLEMGESTMIKLVLTSKEAEEILVALSFRAVQIGRHEVENDETDELGKKLSRSFETHFGWEQGVYEAHRSNDVKMKIITPKTTYK